MAARIWKKISFGGKWNLRDIMRHKSRTIMTLIGIVGWMALLVGSLGMRDTMVSFLNLIDNEIYNYETKINIANCSSQEKIKELKNKEISKIKLNKINSFTVCIHI